MKAPEPALLIAKVMHHRLRPKLHHLAYRIFMVVVGTDELAERATKACFLGLNRFNLFSIHAKDHGPSGKGSLNERLHKLLAHQGFSDGDLAFTLVTMPRVLGFAFNPISLIFAHGCDQTVKAMIYEVNSTFGERHHYVIAAEGSADTLLQEAEKQMHVSPFLPMALTYRFLLKVTPDRLSLAIHDRDEQGIVLSATMNGNFTPLTARAMMRQFLALPFVTLKVVAAIHWQALKLALKGLPVFSHQPRHSRQSSSLGKSVS